MFKNPFFLSWSCGVLKLALGMLWWVLQFNYMRCWREGEQTSLKSAIWCSHLIPLRTCTMGTSEPWFATSDLLCAFQDFVDLCSITSLAVLQAGVPIWVSVILQKLFHGFDYIVHWHLLKLQFALFTSITGTCQKYFICLHIYCCKTYTWTNLKISCSFFGKPSHCWQGTGRRCCLVEGVAGPTQLLPCSLLENCLFEWCFAHSLPSQIHYLFLRAVLLYPST